MSSLNNHLIITDRNAGLRLDKFLFDQFKNKSRSSLQKAISSGKILVNDNQVKTGYKLKYNDRISIMKDEETEMHLAPEKIPLNIIYEDEYLIVVNKPAGMVVHPGAGNKSGTLVNALLNHCKNLSLLSGAARPGIVHRLDKDTSGLLVVAKDDDTHNHLQQQFETKEIQRTYQALVWGVPAQREGEIESYISRSRQDRKKMTVSHSQGKMAITLFKIIKDFQYLSFLELTLKTGRTHQIRVHLNHVNLPVFGDPVYNGRKSQLRRLPSHLQKRGIALLNGIDRQALHAKKLSFIHPKNQESMSFESDLPVDMENILQKIDDILMLRK